MRVLRAFLVAVAVLAAAAAMAPGAWAVGELGLTVSGAPERLIAGDVLTLTAKVTNNDAAKIASDVRVNFIPQVDPFQDTPTLSGASCAPIAPPSLSCSLPGILVPGQSGQVQITSSLPAVGDYAVDAGANGEVLNSDPFEPMTAPFPYPRWTGTVEPKADIRLDLSASNETVASGAVATIRALVTNTTPDATAYGAAVKFSIPPDVQILSKPDGCAGSVLNLICPVGDLGPELTAQRLLTFRSSQQGTYTFVGIATWARADPTIIDTQAQTAVTVLPPPDTTPDPTPAPTPAPALAKVRAASFGTLVSGAPGTGRCVRTRKLSIVLRSIKNVDPAQATIRVTGRKRALVLKGSKAQRPFSLKLPRSGKATVSLTVTLENGRRYTAKRTYRLC